MRRCAEQLQLDTEVGGQVAAKAVARFIGQLWSANLVCYRAVAVMARAMVRTIAKLIRGADVARVNDSRRLKYILKRI